MKKIYYIHPEEKVISSNEKISYTCPKINQFLQQKKNLIFAVRKIKFLLIEKYLQLLLKTK